jgi:hypothetical protein
MVGIRISPLDRFPAKFNAQSIRQQPGRFHSPQGRCCRIDCNTFFYLLGQVMNRFSLSAILILLVGCTTQETAVHPTTDDASKPALVRETHNSGDDADMKTDLPTEREAATEFIDALHTADTAHKDLPLSIPTASDAEEARAIHEFITTATTLPANCYWRPGRRQNTLTFYGVRDVELQDEIIRLLTEKRRQESWKPIRVVFMDSEIVNTRVAGDGTSIGVRGQESMLRESNIGYEPE